MKDITGGPFVVKLYGVVSLGRPTYIAMELMSKGDLKSYLISRFWKWFYPIFDIIFSVNWPVCYPGVDSSSTPRRTISYNFQRWPFHFKIFVNFQSRFTSVHSNRSLWLNYAFAQLSCHICGNMYPKNVYTLWKSYVMYVYSIIYICM